MPELPLPIRGITDASTFGKNPPGFAPPGSLVNVVPIKDLTGRVQMGKRPGLRKVFSTRLGKDGSRRIQGMVSVNRAAAVDTFVLGTALPLSFSNTFSRTAKLLDFNVGLLDVESRSARDTLKVNWSGAVAQVKRGGSEAVQSLTPSAGTPDATPVLPAFCDLSPDGTLGVVGFNYAVSSQNRLLLVFIDPHSGDLVGSKLIAPSGEDTASSENVAVPANAHCWTANALWVARGSTLWYVPTPVWGPRTRLYDPSTTTATQAACTFALGTIASRITALCTYDDGQRVLLLAAFEGVTGAGFFANPTGLIASGTSAKHYRAGVFRLIETASANAAYAYGLTIDPSICTAPTPADAYVETTDSTHVTAVTHNSLRFSRILARAPRGCLPTGICATADGSWAVCFTNQGYGPTSSFLPNGATPYTTIAKFDSTGAMLWESDAQSIIGGEQGGYVNGVGVQYACDIPDESAGGNPGTTSKDGPAIRAIQMDTSGVVFCAGRVNSGLYSVFCFGALGGQLVWRTGLESNRPHTVAYTAVTAGAAAHGVPAGGLSLDRGDRAPIAVGYRNNTWQDTAFNAANTERPYAFAWKLAAATGEIDVGFEVCEDATTASALGIAAGDSMFLWCQPIFTDV